jgi:hypothetical protein
MIHHRIGILQLPELSASAALSLLYVDANSSGNTGLPDGRHKTRVARLA